MLWYLLNNGYEKFLGTENYAGFTPLQLYVYNGIVTKKNICITSKTEPVLELFL